MMFRITMLVLANLLLTACQDNAQTIVPSAVAMTDEALGHYCQMSLAEHEGPKAQIHLAGHDHPVWFSQVRDAIAYTRLPEETADVVAIYVSDMGKAASWAKPGINNWVAADRAVYVIESKSRGGMGTPEAVPFAEEPAARKFAKQNGGRLVGLDEVPDAYVLGPVEVNAPAEDDPAADDSGNPSDLDGRVVTQ